MVYMKALLLTWCYLVTVVGANLGARDPLEVKGKRMTEWEVADKKAHSVPTISSISEEQ
jgi:hypothetical protein